MLIKLVVVVVVVDWNARKLSLFTTAFKKSFHGTHTFADWHDFATAFSVFLENEISYITRGNKQLNFLVISFTGYLAPTQQSKRKRNLTFSDNAKWAQLTSGPNIISFPELRSSWPAVGKQELWEHPFQACAIAYLYADWDCAVSRITWIRLFSIVILKWMLPEVSFPDHWSRGTKPCKRDWTERRTLTPFQPVMRRGPFGFSLTLWGSRRRPCCRCLKSLVLSRVPETI